MYSFLQHIAIVLVPLIISNVLHMIVIKKDILPELKRPISVKLFGKNKTWRGFIFVSFINGLLLLLLNFTLNFQVSLPFFTGFTLGFAYMLFELPNSFMKRKLGIQSGTQASSNKLLFMLIDKMDSAFGVSLIYFLMGNISLQLAMLLFCISSVTHIIFSQLLVQFHLKKSF